MAGMWNVTASQQINAPGTYLVKTAGISLQLPVYGAAINDDPSWTVKDMTGQANPNITITTTNGGTIDGSSTATISVQYESLTFRPAIGGTSWIIA